MADFPKTIRNITGTTLFIGILIGAVACGGGNKKIENCVNQKDDILAKTEADFCNPMTISQFELRVNGWGEECHKQVSKQDSVRVYEKLQEAVKCAEKRRQVDAKAKKCAADLKQLEAQGGECVGAECGPFIEQLNAIAKQCSDPALGQMYKLQAEKQRPRFEERAANGENLAEVREITVFCDEQALSASEGNPKAALKKVLKRVKKDKIIQETPDQGTEMEAFTKRARASCGLAIQTSLAIISEEAELILASEGAKKSSPQWKRTYKDLLKLKRSLNKSKADELFPGSVDPLDEIIEKHR